MKFIKNKEEIKLMEKAGEILAQVHQLLTSKIKAGVSLLELDTIAKRFIAKSGAKSAFLGYNGYQHVLCTSVNDTVIHGIPTVYKLKDGDLLSIDAGVCYKGYFSDAAFSVVVGQKKTDLQTKLLDVTKNALELAIQEAKPGVNLKYIGKLIEDYVLKNNFYVVKSYCGHGIGTSLHEEPMVLNFYEPEAGDFILQEGMTIAIEPMVTVNDVDLYVAEDGWSVKTEDQSLSCHFEHTILIQKEKNKILSKL
ncbi:type I methionyl aminopeptidase [Mycoplasma sp. SG1]|uniref:type I methionyl aminopeptidase n=1 Tax=Mycoplasma sp. SG1 TaxID=2810348 RepID=UPI0020241424|nr:type I methionyl aminopeptidase [Mycoplasma sp. SG1]URM52911.1 type I methionyl aminopeptidase [Mycoplasma sp. SG1]